MAKSSTPSRVPRNAPQRKVHRYVDALFTDDFGREAKLTVTSANGFARKKLDRAAQSLQLRSERTEKKARRIEIREWRAAERSVAAELRESDHRARLLSRLLRTKVRPEKKVRHTPPRERKRHWPHAAVALPKYDGPVIDRNRECGVFMRVRYYSRRTAEAGISQRVALYCFNGAALDPDGNPYVATNIGATIDEALCGFDHLEQVNWAAAKNAKLLMHSILAVDHRQTPDEMMTCGVRWAEEVLGRFDLPYLVTLHAPPPDGDQRNWHLHVLWIYRPLVRTGDHEWQVAEMLRTDLDNPAAMKLYRQMFAAVMTDMSFEAGQNQVWTAKSNADRGLPHEPQVHLGAAKTNQARSGEHVAENEENHERVMRSRAAVIDDALRHADAVLVKAQDTARAIAARFARLPVLPMAIPERVMATTMTLEPLAFGRVPLPSSAIIVVPAATPEATVEPGRFMAVAPAPPILEPSPVRLGSTILPSSFARTARIAIAYPRTYPVPLGTLPIGPANLIPSGGAMATALRLPTRPMAAPPRQTTIDEPLALPPSRSAPASMRVSALIGMRPVLSLAGLGIVSKAITRLGIAGRHDEERRKRERDDAERARADAVRREAIGEQQRGAVERLLHAIAAERHRITRDKAWRYDVDPALLDRYGLRREDIGTDPVQRRLAVAAVRQNGEIAQIGGYLQAAPRALRQKGERWTLDSAAPADIRALVEAWSDDAAVRSAIERVARQAGVPTEQRARKLQPGQAPAGSAWLRARKHRDRAMRGWDDAERLDGGSVTKPGRSVERPGASAASRVDRPFDRASRQSPRAPDTGVER